MKTYFPKFSFPQVSLKKKLNLRLLSARPFVGIASRLKGQKFRHCISHFPSFQLGTTSHVILSVLFGLLPIRIQIVQSLAWQRWGEDPCKDNLLARLRPLCLVAVSDLPFIFGKNVIDKETFIEIKISNQNTGTYVLPKVIGVGRWQNFWRMRHSQVTK